MVPSDSPVYAGPLGYRRSATAAAALDEADLVLSVGAMLGDIDTDGYTLRQRPDARTVLVSIDEPPPESMARFGSTAAAPVFAELAPVIMHERGMVPLAGTMSCDEFNALPPGGY